MRGSMLLNPTGAAIREMIAKNKSQASEKSDDPLSKFELSMGLTIGLGKSELAERWPEVVVRHLHSPICISGRGCCYPQLK